MLNRRRRVHTAWRYAPVVRWRCSSSCCCVLPLAFVGSACTASCSAACSELGAATRLAVTARRLRHERGSKIARPRDAVIIRLADDLGPLNLERDAIAYGPRQGIKCRASPTPIAQTHAPTCMGMAYAPPTERKDAPHSTATGPRRDHKAKYTLQAAAIGGAGALTCSSLGLILHAGHAARHGALPCAPRTHGGMHARRCAYCLRFERAPSCPHSHFAFRPASTFEPRGGARCDLERFSFGRASRRRLGSLRP